MENVLHGFGIGLLALLISIYIVMVMYFLAVSESTIKKERYKGYEIITIPIAVVIAMCWPLALAFYFLFMRGSKS